MDKERQIGSRTFGRWQVAVTKTTDDKLVAYFYDCEGGKPHYTGASYFVETLLGLDGFGIPISEIAALSLNLSVPEWTVDWEELQEISHWLYDLYADLRLGRL